jgi:DNA polymerase
MTELLCVDVETCSAARITNGAAAYAEHPSTRVWCISFAFSGGKHDTPNAFTWVPGDDIPDSVREHIDSGGLMLAHNVGFEHAIWRRIMVPIFGWPTIRLKQWRDSQALAAASNLPVSLEGLARVFKNGPAKDMEGNKLMKSLATVTVDRATGEFIYPKPTADEMAKLISYCETDVLATLYVWWLLPVLSTDELAVWHVDQKINQRGIFIDIDFAERMAAMAERRKEDLSDDVFRITGSLCANSTSAPALKAWLKAEGVGLKVKVREKLVLDTTQNLPGSMLGAPPSKVKVKVKTETLDKEAVAEMLKDDNIDGAVRLVLDNRVEANKSASLAKLKRIPEMVSRDGRLRGALRYSIAHTGRWAGVGIQVHNLPKDKRDPKRADHVRRMIWAGDLDTLMMSEDLPLDAMSQSLRAVIIASPGRELLAADYSAIEARVVAWLAGAQGLLDTFARGEDVYVKAAKDIGSDDRQLGKVCVLALGYGMGVLKFVDTARRPPYNVEMTRKEAFKVQRGWRKANTEIVGFWKTLEEACHGAVANKGKRFSAGDHISVIYDGRAMRIVLPSGRSLRYWQPKLKRVTKKIVSVNEDGELVTNEFDSIELQFFTVGKNKSRMSPEGTYGGKLCENVTQAVARDLLAYALVTLDAKGYPLVLHAHDSIVAEVLKGSRSIEEFCRLMAALPPWAAGCPIAAEGYIGAFFKG